MKQLAKQIKDQNCSEFFSDEKQLLNKKRRISNINSIDLVRKSRQNSLDYLTKAVIMYIKEAKSDYINLNKIAKDIKIQKRRLYDVINVLQGK
jgi:adenylate cyclase